MGSLYLSTPEPKGLFGIGILHRITLQKKSDPLRIEAKYRWSVCASSLFVALSSQMMHHISKQALNCPTDIPKFGTTCATFSALSIWKWNSPSLPLLCGTAYTQDLLCLVKMFSFIHFPMFPTQSCVAAAVKSFVYSVYLLHIWLVKALKHLGTILVNLLIFFRLSSYVMLRISLFIFPFFFLPWKNPLHGFPNSAQMVHEWAIHPRGGGGDESQDRKHSHS